MSDESYTVEGLRCGSCFHNNHYDPDKNEVSNICGHTGGYYSDYEVCRCIKFRPIDKNEFLDWLLDKRLEAQ